MRLETLIKRPLLAHAIKLAGEMDTEIHLILQHSGEDLSFSTRVVDPANVTMIGFEIPKPALLPITLDLPCDREDIGLDLMGIKKALEWMKGETVRLSLTDKHIFLSAGKGLCLSCSLDFKMSLRDPAFFRKMPNPPVIDLPCRFNIDGHDFFYALHVARQFSDKATLTLRPHIGEQEIRTALGEERWILEVHTEGEEGAISIPLPVVILQRGKEDAYSSTFALDYLEDAMRHAKMPLTMEMGTDILIKVNWEYQQGTFYYLQAPRIERG